jgi:hypothetical protein
VIRILKDMRKLKVVRQLYFTQSQNKLLPYFYQNVISVKNKEKLEDFQWKKSMFAFGALKRVLNNMKNSQTDSLLI